MDKLTAGNGNAPTIGIAMSGGGYRALLVGAGVLAAFDDRTTGSKEPGNLGGLLQSSTYVSGLSGGGWLVGSLFVNNFTSVQDIIAGEADGHTSIWNFGRPMLEGPKTRHIPGLSTYDYWKTISNQVNGKKQAGFDLSISDYWARTLSFQMINATNGGPGMLYMIVSIKLIQVKTNLDKHILGLLSLNSQAFQKLNLHSPLWCHVEEALEKCSYLEIPQYLNFLLGRWVHGIRPCLGWLL
jgi:lysophospholipase